MRFFRPRFFRLFAVVVLALAVAACANPFKKKTPPPCPSGIIVKDASRKVVYREGPGRDVTDILFEASLPRVLLSCRYDDTGVEVTTLLTIVAARGPADTARSATVRYFAAVIAPAGDIIGKREFETDLTFPINIDRGATTDELVQRIPVGKDISAEEFTIAIGFQLTREELEANRKAGPTSLIAPAGVRPSIPSTGPSPKDDFPQARPETSQ